ncbi:hypothetical protein BMJ32_17595 [Sinorhizobium medicae]|nr:hypothetical protein BMJ32_17595 [Sinorhizobium medicae]PLU51912.1 hypothetical protein BMJ23_25455 [Sinorhizobium medicae]PLU63508.1 hypothetical protein BMJ22_29250 [Sinorhizobium medicae]
MIVKPVGDGDLRQANELLQNKGLPICRFLNDKWLPRSLIPFLELHDYVINCSPKLDFPVQDCFHGRRLDSWIEQGQNITWQVTFDLFRS